VLDNKEKKKMIDYSKPTHIKAHAFGAVELWFHSPTGDSTDFFITQMTCDGVVQAEMIAQQFAKTNNVVWYDRNNRAVSPEVTRLGSEVL
jgi:hypothetical protein